MKKLRIGLVTRREMKGYLFMLPWMIGCVIFFLQPLFVAVRYSLSDVTMAAGYTELKFVGLANFKWVYTNYSQFVTSLFTHFGSAILETAVILVFALIIAMMLNKITRGKALFRTLFFLPIVAVSGPVLERLIGNGAMDVPMMETYGMINIINSALPEVVAEPLTMLFSELIKVLWFCGVPILLYMTGLQKIDKSRYEAALIDGADAWISFWKVTLPAIRPFILLCGIYTMVFISTNATSEPLNIVTGNMGMLPYGGIQAATWVYALIQGVLLALFYLMMRPRKAREVEIIKNRAQVEAERMHAERARNMKGGKKHGRNR